MEACPDLAHLGLCGLRKWNSRGLKGQRSLTDTIQYLYLLTLWATQVSNNLPVQNRLEFYTTMQMPNHSPLLGIPAPLVTLQISSEMRSTSASTLDNKLVHFKSSLSVKYTPGTGSTVSGVRSTVSSALPAVSSTGSTVSKPVQGPLYPVQVPLCPNQYRVHCVQTSTGSTLSSTGSTMSKPVQGFRPVYVPLCRAPGSSECPCAAQHYDVNIVSVTTD